MPFFVFFRVVNDAHGLGDRFLNGQNLLRTRNRDLSKKNLTNEDTCRYDRTFHFFEESKNRVVEFRAVASEVVHLFGEEACAKGKENGAELFVERTPVQRSECEILQCRRDSLLRQLLTDANKCLIALIARSNANGNSGDTGYLTILCVLEKYVLLNVPDKLGDDDVAGARQCAVLDQKAAVADGGDHAVNKEEWLFRRTTPH